MAKGMRHDDLGGGLEALAHDVIGAAIEVHRALGPGFLEGAYERALSIELSHRGIDHSCQYPVRVSYRGIEVGEGRVDILVARQLVLELKAVDRFEPVHEAITFAYLKALDLNLALLINFKAARVTDGLRRIIRTSSMDTSPTSPLRG